MSCGTWSRSVMIFPKGFIVPAEPAQDYTTNLVPSFGFTGLFFSRAIFGNPLT